jgi:hypothetical protein
MVAQRARPPPEEPSTVLAALEHIDLADPQGGTLIGQGGHLLLRHERALIGSGLEQDRCKGTCRLRDFDLGAQHRGIGDLRHGSRRLCRKTCRSGGEHQQGNMAKHHPASG